MADANYRIYNDPAGGDQSSIGPQFNDFYYQKKALIEARKKQFFSQMADTTSMPKHMGKRIKRYHYLPLLDDANINDQGINASGVANDDLLEATIKIIKPTDADDAVVGDENIYITYYAVGQAATAALAADAAELAAVDIFKQLGVFVTSYAATFTALTVTADPAWFITANADVEAAAVPQAGNMYGSSKDVGTIAGKMPALSENGGRVNRVGFKRVELEGSLEKFGFFDEYTQESMDFDTDPELMMHVNREMINGANEITEDALQIDLLNAAGVIRYGGDATVTAEIIGDTNVEDDITVSLITYEDLMRLSIDLDNNRCPKATKIITGTRMIDTKVIDAARYLYIGSELIPMVKRMTDLFGNQAFIPVQQYAAGGTLALGEIGTVDQFRIIVVPEMMHWAGAGAAVGSGGGTTPVNAGYRSTGGNYDVFPMLVIGSESFTTIGFQTDGKTVKFKITHKKPGKETADRFDPYGETGFMSIKWYYGFMNLRPERIAVCKAVAEY